MATIIDTYTLTDNEEKALMAFILLRSKEVEGFLAGNLLPQDRFDNRVQKLMLEKLVLIYTNSDVHPGYWPKHPALQQQHLADVMFFPITINGATLAPEYVVYLRNAIRELLREEAYRSLVAKYDVLPQTLIEHFFRDPYFNF